MESLRHPISQRRFSHIWLVLQALSELQIPLQTPLMHRSSAKQLRSLKNEYDKLVLLYF